MMIDCTASFLSEMFGAPGHVWSAGTMAAFAGLEIVARPEDENGRLILRKAGTAARLDPNLPAEARLLAFEVLSSDPRGWNHGIALCMPVGSVQPARPLAMIADDGAIEPAERGAPVLDLGIGQGPVRALFRPGMPEALGLAGQGWAEAAPLLAPYPGTWIIDAPALRIERREAGRIGFHSIPAAIESGLTHAATTPVPPGMVPVVHVYPPHPARLRPGKPAAFDPALHARFQEVLARYGRADLRALKCEVRAQLREGRFEPPEADRHGLAVIRVTLRQECHLSGPPPRAWLERFDRPLLRALDEG